MAWPDVWSEMLRHVPVLVLRTGLLFGLVLLIIRWTGKRAAGHLAPFDLALIIMVSEVAAIPISDLDVDLLHGLLPVVVLGALHVAVTTVNLHSRRIEHLTEGDPKLLVKDGAVLLPNLGGERVSRADLYAALRLHGVTDVRTVERAWLEPTGGISVVLDPRHRPVTAVELDAALAGLVERLAERVTESSSAERDVASESGPKPARPGAPAPATDPMAGAAARRGEDL